MGSFQSLVGSRLWGLLVRSSAPASGPVPVAEFHQELPSLAHVLWLLAVLTPGSMCLSPPPLSLLKLGPPLLPKLRPC